MPLCITLSLVACFNINHGQFINKKFDPFGNGMGHPNSICFVVDIIRTEDILNKQRYTVFDSVIDQ